LCVIHDPLAIVPPSVFIRDRPSSINTSPPNGHPSSGDLRSPVCGMCWMNGWLVGWLGGWLFGCPVHHPSPTIIHHPSCL
jgi:hypothetical protein